MIICKKAKTPYNANKWILGVFAKWEYGGCLLYAYISRIFVFLWCTPLHIECFQYVIDKCYHYRLTSKIFDMVFAACGRTTVLYAIEFHATDFSFEHMSSRSYVIYMNVCSYVHTSVIWTSAHMSIHSDEKHMNICSCVHMSCITKTHAWMVVHMSVYVNTWTCVHMYKWLYAI